MTDPTPDLLERLDATPLPPVLAEDIVRTGRAMRARRRRASIAGAAAAVLLIAGGGVMVTQMVDHSSGKTAQTASEPGTDAIPGPVRDLPVKVTYLADALPRGHASSLPPVLQNEDRQVRAAFNSDSDSIVYISTMSYSGSCPPVGTATLDGAGGVHLTLAPDPTDDVCTADANAVVATITGVEVTPSSLTVTEGDVTREVPFVQQFPIPTTPGGTAGPVTPKPK